MRTGIFWAWWILLVLALPHQRAFTANPTITVAQSPSTAITSTNLSGSGGSDLNPSLISSTALSLNISNALVNNILYTTQTSWYCYFSLGSASSNWPSHLSLSVKLSSAGSGTGSTSSSTNGAYVVLTTTPQAIFNGQGNQSGITVQCQLNNLSLANCPPTSSTATLPIVMTLQSQ